MKKIIKITKDELRGFVEDVYIEKTRENNFHNITRQNFDIAQSFFNAMSNRSKNETIDLSINKVRGIVIVVAELAKNNWIHELFDEPHDMEIEDLVEEIWNKERNK